MDKLHILTPKRVQVYDYKKVGNKDERLQQVFRLYFDQ